MKFDWLPKEEDQCFRGFRETRPGRLTLAKKRKALTCAGQECITVKIWTGYRKVFKKYESTQNPAGLHYEWNTLVCERRQLWFTKVTGMLVRDCFKGTPKMYQGCDSRNRPEEFRGFRETQACFEFIFTLKNCHIFTDIDFKILE